LWILMPFVLKLATSKFDIDKTVEAYRRANHFYSMVDSYLGYKEQMARFTAFSNKQLKDLEVVRSKKYVENELHVLIIGESTTSTHMGVYGYHRNTTPHLDKLKDELVFFTDAVSSSPPGTMANLKKILTLANSEDQSGDLLATNIVNVMKSSGFKTYWVSNQLVLGEHDTITTVFAKQSDRVNFTNTTNSISYDEKVLPILDDYIAEEGTKKFIVVHLIGTHMKYRQRYPESFEKFVGFEDITKREFHNDKKRKYINDYDNAILYHDHILNEIFKRVKKVSARSTITYMSDHGEEVYDLQNLHGHHKYVQDPIFCMEQ
jgi:heptose-I-phosphate ethanolaminephosphotransferase